MLGECIYKREPRGENDNNNSEKKEGEKEKKET